MPVLEYCWVGDRTRKIPLHSKCHSSYEFRIGKYFWQYIFFTQQQGWGWTLEAFFDSQHGRYGDWTTSWTVRRLNPGGGEIFSTRPDRLWGPPSPPHWVPGLSRGPPGRGFDHPPLRAPRLKSRFIVHLLPLWTFVGCYRVNITFTLGGL
jgi:hypothetical protein